MELKDLKDPKALRDPKEKQDHLDHQVKREKLVNLALLDTLVDQERKETKVAKAEMENMV